VTDATVVHTSLRESAAAGTALGTHIAAAFGLLPPDAVIVFASSAHRYTELLIALDAACHPRVLVGCSSAGKFTNDAQQEGTACAIALRSDEMRFAVGLGRGLREDRRRAAAELVSYFSDSATHTYPYRTALVLTDALAGHADDLVEELTRLTGGVYQFFGGGTGDDAQFQRTHVFSGVEAVADAVVALEILSDKPLGIGVGHGWQPSGNPLRVTEADGMCLRSLNAIPASEVFEEHAETTAQSFDAADPLPFFLHNVLGIETDQGHKLRVPLSVNADGSVVCAADIPTEATVRIMTATATSASEAAAHAVGAALGQLGTHRPKVALVFDCAATRLRLGAAFSAELEAVGGALGTAPYAGCNTYGQIARVDGQFSGFHNCTAVVCVIPD